MRELFVHGELERSQQQAEHGYLRFRTSDPRWAAKFELLTAEVMQWRGLFQEAFLLLTKTPIDSNNAEDIVQALALEGVSLTRLDRLAESNQTLTLADGKCRGTALTACGGVLRARGLLALTNSQPAEARRFFLESLHFASAHNDQLLEATALQNLSATSLHEEKFDEALEWSKSTYKVASQLGAADLAQAALGNQGWAYYGLGNTSKALKLFTDAEVEATQLGDVGYRVLWLTALGNVYSSEGQLLPAEASFLHALKLARETRNQDDIVNASMDLAEVYVESGQFEQADRYSSLSWSIAQKNRDDIDMLYSHLIAGQSAAARRDWKHAISLLNEVQVADASQTSMRWAAQHALAGIYEVQERRDQALHSYQAALASFETARAQLNKVESQLPFLTNATSIYDDYIDFLIAHGKSAEALQAADWSRARTLEKGVTTNAEATSLTPPTFNATQIAQRANATLLFYWLGEKKSYLWAISPQKTLLIPLPAKHEINALVQRYNSRLLALEDPAANGSDDGVALYNMLVAPASGLVSPGRPIILFADGQLSQLNFETLLVPSPRPHYWIEDATIFSAPSLRMFAAAKPAALSAGRLLLLGNPISPDPEFPDLPNARDEIAQVRKHFSTAQQTIIDQSHATPVSYFSSKPEQFSYIHFVAHGIASNTDPLDSAVILSRAKEGDDSFKLYARDILTHPIDARLVTISACDSSGTRTVAGEGLVGLSWAFLRAGAHNTIGTLWEVSDDSTPQLMAHLYSGLDQGHNPATALRDAKLALLHSNSTYRRPFYWAPFQLYAGR